MTLTLPAEGRTVLSIAKMSAMESALPGAKVLLNKYDKDLIYKIAITKIPKIGHKNAKRLISHFGNPKAVFQASRKELSTIFGIGDQRIDAIKGKEAIDRAFQEIEYNRKNNINALYFEDKRYPARLKEVDDGPIVIYVKGNVDLNPHRMIAIVGTRKPTSFGLDLCEKLIGELAEYQPTIVSGLAFGIDAMAHRCALKYNLPTLGVVAHGLADIYPVKHRNLAEKMIDFGGVMSEFTHNITAEREFFPMRNRIIAGLSDGLVVVQTARKGGSMISADLANAYHRDVFAFPGRVGDTTSEGCNLLIKNNRAQLIESGSDLAFQLGWDDMKPAAAQPELFVDLNDCEQKIVDVLKEGAVRSMDQLSAQTKIAQSKLSTTLLGLEFKKLILVHPGKRFSLK